MGLPTSSAQQCPRAHCELLCVEAASDASKAGEEAEKFRNVSGHSPLDLRIWIKLLHLVASIEVFIMHSSLL